jgi:hypothetical protein
VLGGSHLFHSPTRASSYKTLEESAQFLKKEKNKIKLYSPMGSKNKDRWYEDWDLRWF